MYNVEQALADALVGEDILRARREERVRKEKDWKVAHMEICIKEEALHGKRSCAVKFYCHSEEEIDACWAAITEIQGRGFTIDMKTHDYWIEGTITW